MGFEQWAELSWQGWLTLSVVVAVLGTLAFTRTPTDVVLVGAVTLLLITGVIDSKAALSGMSNEGMLTVAVLYAVVAGLEATGGTALLVRRFLGRPRSEFDALVKMMVPVSFVSAFLNNTPVVAMFMPAIKDWSKHWGISVSKLMMPLSYAAVLGGVCTLIGTSTNLVVHGLLKETTGSGMQMFDLTWIGVPCTIAGISFIIMFRKWLLPNRIPAINEFADPREYTIEMLVEPNSALVGKTIEQAGLRQLPGVFLVEIDRGGDVLPAVSPTERLQANDRLVFAGVVGSVVELQKIRGLIPATNQVFKLDAPRTRRTLIEAVVSNRCPIVDKTIREGRFRTVYNAAVIAVARAGERLNMKIGDIVLRPGDTLLLEAHPSFVEAQRNSHHFYLVSTVENSNPPRHEKAGLAVGIMAVMILLASTEWFGMTMLKAAMLAAGVMLITRCCTSAEARRGVEWQILIAIAASFGLGKAIESSGLAHVFASSLISMAGGSPFWSLVVVYGITIVLTELITNNAAAVLVFPIAMQAARDLNVEHYPFALTVALAASLGFATPLGYQTHMMVYGPGGYRFSDFLRLGVPLDIICWTITIIIVPLVFPLTPL